MSAERKALRADLRAALASIAAEVPALAGVKVISAWSQSVDPKALPVLGVTVPTEEVEPISFDVEQLDMRAIIVAKVAITGADGTDGPEGEDELDDLALALCAPIEAALIRETGPARDAELRSSAIEISGTGSPRVGTLTLTFGVQTTRDRTRP